MAELPIVVDDVSVLPEPARDFYVARDGKHFLNAKAVGGYEVADVTNLKKAAQTERKMREEREAALKRFDGLDPDKAREAVTTLAELGDIKELRSLDEKLATREKQLSEKFEKDKAGLETRWKSDLAKSDEKIKGLTGQLSNALIDSAATRAISEAKGSVELLLPIIRQCSRIKMDDSGRVSVEIVGQNGEVRSSNAAGSLDNLTIPELVAEMKNNPVYARAFDGTSASGGGASGGGGSGGGGSSGREFRISEADARDVTKYRAARAQAEKNGQTLVVG